MTNPVDISVVIPAYNEAKRLPVFLERVIAYCCASDKSHEIIIVDDGSKDGTAAAAEAFRGRFDRLRILRNEVNSGKGYSVKKGFFAAHGDVQVFLDADGSTQPEEIGRNFHFLEEGYDIVIGSRVLRDPGTMVQTRRHRQFMGFIFNFVIKTVLFDDIRDTQCGFKMFKRDVVEPLFSRTYLHRFGFDIELLYLAHKMGYKIKEQAVNWRHVTGSKVNLVVDSLAMLVNILQVRNWHCTPINRFSKYMGPDEYRFMYDMEEYHWWFTSRRDLIRQLMERLKMESPKILDLGAGTGANLAMFQSFGEACGVDISEQAVAFCRQRGLENVTLGSVDRLDFHDQQFDVVACLDVLEHTPDPVRVLKEIKRVLKDGGRIIVTVPAFRLLWSQHDEALCHRRRYERGDFCQDLAEAGLKADKISYFFFTSFFVVAPIRIVRRFIVRKGKMYSDTTSLPPGFLNAFLKILFKFERNITLCLGLPFGTTLYAIISKKTT